MLSPTLTENQEAPRCEHCGGDGWDPDFDCRDYATAAPCPVCQPKARAIVDHGSCWVEPDRENPNVCTVDTPRCRVKRVEWNTALHVLRRYAEGK